MPVHFLYDHAGCLPSFMVLTDGLTSDIRVVKEQDFASHLLPDSIENQNVNMSSATIHSYRQASFRAGATINRFA